MKAKSKKTVKKSVTTKVKKSTKKAKTNSSLIRTNINIDKTLHSKAKQFAIKKDLSLNALINTAVREYVK